MDKIEKAMKFSFEAHITQKRKHSGIPYFTHCVEVMKRVSDYGVTDEDILSAALLHDVHEDAPDVSEYVESEFGKRVSDIMMECSRPKDQTSLEQKVAFMRSFENKSIESIIIKIADRYCNMMDFIRNPKTKDYGIAYAVQAYPLVTECFYRIRCRKIDNVSEDVQRNVLFDALNIKETVSNNYQKD